jgi:hypothetical protein
MTQTLENAIQPAPDQVQAYENRRAVGAKRRLGAGSAPLGQPDSGKAANWTEDQLIALVKEAKKAPDQWFPFSQHASDVSARTRVYQLQRGSVKKYDGIPLEFNAMTSSDGGNWIWVKWSPDAISQEWARKIGEAAPSARPGVGAAPEEVASFLVALESKLDAALSGRTPLVGDAFAGADGVGEAELGSVARSAVDGGLYILVTSRTGREWARVVMQENGPVWMFPRDVDEKDLSLVAQGDGVVVAGPEFGEDEF